MQAPEEAVGAFVTSGDHAGLAQYCENFELDLRHSDVELITSRGIYKVHLLSYLLQGQLDRARPSWAWQAAWAHVGDESGAEVVSVGAVVQHELGGERHEEHLVERRRGW